MDQSFLLIGIRSLGSDWTHLVLSSMLHYLFIDNLIHDLETLDGLLLCDANISLLQGDRTETAENKSVVIRDYVDVMDLLQIPVGKT